MNRDEVYHVGMIHPVDAAVLVMPEGFNPSPTRSIQDLDFLRGQLPPPQYPDCTNKRVCILADSTLILKNPGKNSVKKDMTNLFKSRLNAASMHFEAMGGATTRNLAIRLEAIGVRGDETLFDVVLVVSNHNE